MANTFKTFFVDTTQTPDHVVASHIAYRTDRYAVTNFRSAQVIGSVFGVFDDTSKDVSKTLFIDTVPLPDRIVPQWLAYNRSFLTNISTIVSRGLVALGVGAFLTNIAEIPNRAAYFFRNKKGT